MIVLHLVIACFFSVVAGAVNQTAFLATAVPAMAGQVCDAEGLKWPAAVEGATSGVRVCGQPQVNRNVPRVTFARGASALIEPAAIEEEDGTVPPDDFLAAVESNGNAVVLGVFTQVFATDGDSLIVRLQSPPRARRLQTPTFLFVSTYVAPNLTVVFDAPGNTVPMLVYDQAAVTARQLAIGQLDAEAIFVDLNFTTSQFSWTRGDMVPRTAVVVVALVDTTATAPGSNKFVNVFKRYDGAATNGIIIGVIFIFIGTCCLPCIVIYIFACCCMLCCGKAKGQHFLHAAMESVRNGGAVDLEDPDAGAPPPKSRFARCFACLDRSVAISVAAASVGSALFTIVQLVALVFTIVLLQNGLAYFKDGLIPDLQLLVLALIADWNIDISGIVAAFRTFTSLFNLAVLAVTATCLSARNILAAAFAVFVLQFIGLSVRLDAFVRVKHLGAGGALFELIGNILATVLTLLMQTSLQQINLLIHRAVAGDVLNFDVEAGCTDLDTELLPITRPGTIIFIALASLAIGIAFLHPRNHAILQRVKSSANVLYKAVYLLLGGLLVITTTMLGVWTNFAIDHTDLVARAASGVKFFRTLTLGDALKETQDSISRLNAMFFIILFPPLIVLTKLGEAAAEAPIWVSNAEIAAEIDPRWVRILIFVTNMTALALEVYAVVAVSPDAVIVAAALILFREMVIKLGLKIVAIVRAEPPAAVGAIGAAGSEMSAAAKPADEFASARNSQVYDDSSRAPPASSPTLDVVASVPEPAPVAPAPELDPDVVAAPAPESAPESDVVADPDVAPPQLPDMPPDDSESSEKPLEDV